MQSDLSASTGAAVQPAGRPLTPEPQKPLVNRLAVTLGVIGVILLALLLIAQRAMRCH